MHLTTMSMHTLMLITSTVPPPIKSMVSSHSNPERRRTRNALPMMIVRVIPGCRHPPRPRLHHPHHRRCGRKSPRPPSRR